MGRPCKYCGDPYTATGVCDRTQCRKLDERNSAATGCLATVFLIAVAIAWLIEKLKQLGLWLMSPVGFAFTVAILVVSIIAVTVAIIRRRALAKTIHAGTVGGEGGASQRRRSMNGAAKAALTGIALFVGVLLVGGMVLAIEMALASRPTVEPRENATASTAGQQIQSESTPPSNASSSTQSIQDSSQNVGTTEQFDPGSLAEEQNHGPSSDQAQPNNSDYESGQKYEAAGEYSLAFACYKRAGDAGNAEAYLRIAKLYSLGKLGVGTSEPGVLYEQALPWYQQAAKGGNAEAQQIIDAHKSN